MSAIDLSKISSEQLEELLKKKKEQERLESITRREAYEAIRADVMHKFGWPQEMPGRCLTLLSMKQALSMR
jgi:hypothetical protein